MKQAFAITFVLCSIWVSAQDTVKPFTFFGYLESYYNYDFGRPVNGKRPAFLYNFTQHNQINVNLVFLKLAYEKKGFRFNLAPMLGSYSQSNLSNEPFYLRQIFEANLGFRLMKKKELWLDAGVFPSHIGFESAIAKDCPTLSRSLQAENSPYFETGLKLSYRHNERLMFAGLILNGWQRISWTRGRTLPSFGTQIVYQPVPKLLLNYSTFLGTDKDDSERRMRYFNNVYAIYSPISELSITLGFDIGTEQRAKGSNRYYFWYSPVFIIRYFPLKALAIAARYEFYRDNNEVIVFTGTPNGFQAHGLSINFDYNINAKVVWRIEARLLKSQDNVFDWNGHKSAQNYNLLTSLAIFLSK